MSDVRVSTKRAGRIFCSHLLGRIFQVGASGMILWRSSLSSAATGEVCSCSATRRCAASGQH